MAMYRITVAPFKALAVTHCSFLPEAPSCPGENKVACSYGRLKGLATAGSPSL